MTFKIRTKICGITNQEDALYATSLGVDALGFVFYSQSPRFVNAKEALEIIKVLPPFVSIVGLFVNHTKQEIEEILQIVPIEIIQFHGDEEEDFCQSFSRPYIKAIRVKSSDDIYQAISQYTQARALLLDAYHEKEYGGTGEQFDWTLLPHYLKRPWILAGGLKPENIREAVKKTKCMAVDVSSGVESSLGIKSSEKIKAFLNGVSNA